MCAFTAEQQLFREGSAGMLIASWLGNTVICQPSLACLSPRFRGFAERLEIAGVVAHDQQEGTSKGLRKNFVADCACRSK